MLINIMKFTSICICLVASGLNFSCAKKLPSYVKKCKLSDPIPVVSKCISESAMDLLPRIVKGIPEMKIPPIEPLHIPKLEVEGGNGADIGGFIITFYNIDVYGIKDAVVKEYIFDKDKPYMGLHAYLPHLYVTTNYKLKGKILLFELDSEGTAYMNITDIETKSHHRKMSYATRNGKKYIVLEDDEIESVKYKKGALHMNDIFKGNEPLTQQVNQAINDNFEELTKDINPLLYEALRLILLGVLRPFFNEYSLDEMFD